MSSKAITSHNEVIIKPNGEESGNSKAAKVLHGLRPTHKDENRDGYDEAGVERSRPSPPWVK
jgi:hypothetical protein